MNVMHKQVTLEYLVTEMRRLACEYKHLSKAKNLSIEKFNAHLKSMQQVGAKIYKRGGRPLQMALIHHQLPKEVGVQEWFDTVFQECM